MMIRGRYDQERRPRLTARVSLSETGVESNVEFLVSTGSPRSFLNQEDAERLGWKQGGRKYGQKLVWAGQTSPGRLTKALVVLTQEDRTEIRLVPDLGIAEPGHYPAGRPSVLGTDLLQGFKMTMSPKEGILELRPSPERRNERA